MLKKGNALGWVWIPWLVGLVYLTGEKPGIEATSASCDRRRFSSYQSENSLKFFCVQLETGLGKKMEEMI